MPILKGGLKPRKAKVWMGMPIGEGKEGIAVKSGVVLKHGKRQRAVQMVEKWFRPTDSAFQEILKGFKGYQRQFGNPNVQFKIMKELQKINREKKLGLHIVPTIRLRRRQFGKSSLIMTMLERLENPNEKQRTEL